MYHPECMQCVKCMVGASALVILHPTPFGMLCDQCGPCDCGNCTGILVCTAPTEKGGDGIAYNGKRFLLEHRPCNKCGYACMHDSNDAKATPDPYLCVVCGQCAHDASVEVLIARTTANEKGRVHIACADCALTRQPLVDSNGGETRRILLLSDRTVAFADAVKCACCGMGFGRVTPTNRSDASSNITLGGYLSYWAHPQCRRDEPRALNRSHSQPRGESPRPSKRPRDHTSNRRYISSRNSQNPHSSNR
jgi:hypothetical protein